MVLESLTRFADEFKHHTEEQSCQKGIAQSVPCETFCPAHVDVPGYIALVAEGRSAEAVALIRKDNPFPTACGYVCEHPCESAAAASLIDAPINIRAIKSTPAIRRLPTPFRPPKRQPDTGRTIAVIGAAPPVSPVPISSRSWGTRWSSMKKRSTWAA